MTIPCIVPNKFDPRDTPVRLTILQFIDLEPDFKGRLHWKRWIDDTPDWKRIKPIDRKLKC